MKDEFSFLSFFGASGNARLVLIFIVLITVGYLGFRQYHFKEKFSHLVSEASDLKTFDNKVIYVEAIEESVGYPPYGDMIVSDIETGEKKRLNFDKYFDSSPSFSNLNNVIYFESKRSDGVEFEMMSSPSDLYKYDISTGEILNARSDIEFSLKYEDSEIISPLISNFNDSLIAFFERRFLEQRLVVCNYISKKILVERKIEAHTSTIVDSFLKEYVVVYDASIANATKLGTYFIHLYDQNVEFIPDKYKHDYYHPQ